MSKSGNERKYWLSLLLFRNNSINEHSDSDTRRRTQASFRELSSSLTPEPAVSKEQAIRQLLETNACVRCDLSNANLSETDLRDANLEGANLTGANLSGANLAQAYLVGATLNGAVLRVLNDSYDREIALTEIAGVCLS